MTANEGELVDAARQLVERTTAAQGLPLVVEDDRVLRRVAVIVSASTRGTTPASSRGRSNNRSGRSSNPKVVADGA